MATATVPPPTPAAQPTPGLLSLEEFAKRPDTGHPEELVHGRVVTMPPPKPRLGQICNDVAYILTHHARLHGLGHVLSNDSGVITQRDPDSLRGADVAFYRFEKVPRGPIGEGYLPVPPDLVIEVMSPDDRWKDVYDKVADYLGAGVPYVGVLNPEARTLHVFEPDRPVRVLGEDDEFTLPALLGDFRERVRRFID